MTDTVNVSRSTLTTIRDIVNDAANVLQWHNSDKGIDLFNVANVIDTLLSDKVHISPNITVEYNGIHFVFRNGEHTQSVVNTDSNLPDKIKAIGLVRFLTGMGLKEAKDAIDSVVNRHLLP